MKLRKLREARIAFDKVDLEKVEILLRTLSKRGNPEAVLLINSFSSPIEKIKSFEKRYKRALEFAAKRMYPPALYRLGAYYDMGEQFDTFQYPLDKEKASSLFSKAAKLGHAHSQWIYAMDLLYGTDFVIKNIVEGKRYLSLSVKQRFVGALVIMSRFHHNGEFGFVRNQELATFFQRKAESNNVTGYS